MLQFILMFTAVLFLSAIFANGFYNITRGQWIIQPDGSRKYVGMVFKFWSKFLQWHAIEKEWYSGLELLKKIAEAKLSNGAMKVVGKDSVTLELSAEEFVQFVSILDNEYTGVYSEYENDQYVVKIYKKEKVYKVPELIRMPFGGCITCQSSVFGTICFLFWVKIIAISVYTYPSEAAYIFTSFSIVVKIGLWIFFCISLAWVNEIIFNINHKLKQQK